MQVFKWLAIGSGIVLILACFMPWVTIDSKNIIISGVDATGTSFGKPGYMHFLLAAISIILLLIQKTLAIRVAIFLTAFNAAWSVRNFIVISACYGGICPEKQAGLYLIVASSMLLMIGNLFTGFKEKESAPTSGSESIPQL